jgi:hypothetical protein
LQVQIHYRVFDKEKKELDKTYHPKRGPEIIGPGENDICQGENLIFYSFGILQYVFYIRSGDKDARIWNLCRLV